MHSPGCFQLSIPSALPAIQCLHRQEAKGTWGILYSHCRGVAEGGQAAEQLAGCNFSLLPVKSAQHCRHLRALLGRRSELLI